MGVFKRWTKSSNGTKTAYWYIRYSVGSKEKWESVGKVGDVTKTIAQRKLEDVKKKIRRGVYGYEDVTLPELEGDYIEYVKSIKKLRTWKRREEHFKTLKSFFGGKPLSQITPKDIEDFKLSSLKTHKPATINRELATLRNAFNLAQRWKKFYGANPVSISGLLAEDNLRDWVLTPEEEDRLLACCAPHLKPIIVTALNTGMRVGEILSLTLENVDFDNGVFVVTASNSKSKKIKRIPINSILSAMLRELKIRNQKKSDYVFLSDNGKPFKNIKTAYGNACRHAGIKGLRFHDLRHTAGTRMLESGAGIVAITKILGNSSVEMTMKRYLHPEDSLRDAVEKLANFNKNRSKNRSNDK